MQAQPHGLRLNLTRELKHQNAYTLALDSEFRRWAFNEERAPQNKGLWRKEVFGVPDGHPMDLEIGTGNGLHFAHRTLNFPQRAYVGIEIKYKPLIQTIRRSIKGGSQNAAVARYHAMQMDDLFGQAEINDVYIHFPDPWTSPRKPKNRLVQEENLLRLWSLQRAGAKIEFKTDSEEAFKWGLREIAKTSYQVEFVTHDLHGDLLAQHEKENNFVTAFESIFLRQRIKIHFVRLRKL